LMQALPALAVVEYEQVPPCRRVIEDPWWLWADSYWPRADWIPYLP
jgi:hypothetical protein